MKKQEHNCQHEKLEYRPCCDSVICKECGRKWEKPWCTTTTKDSGSISIGGHTNLV